MTTREIIRAIGPNRPLVRKLEKLAEAKKLSLDETIIFCLSGASTRGANRARKQNGRVSFFGHGVEAPTNER